MFDKLVADTTGASGSQAVAAWATVENAACARRYAAMVAVLDACYAASGSARREQWCVDNWSAVCAQLGAAQRCTGGAASHHLLIAVALRDRLPKVAALFHAGRISQWLVSTIVKRTAQILDVAALRAVDAELAVALAGWAPMSAVKTERAIDALVHRLDPHAVRRTQQRARSREVQFDLTGSDGLAAVWGTLFATDAAAVNARLDALAATVCANDPRTTDQRRADALGALAHGQDRLACLCEHSDCQAAANPPSTGVVIHIVAQADTITAPPATNPTNGDGGGGDGRDGDSSESPPDATPRTGDAAAQHAALDGRRPPLFDKPLDQLTWIDALTDRDPGEHPATAPAVIIGGPFLPGPLLRRAALGAQLKQIVHPGDALPEPRYSPSAALAHFVRCRDLTCRHPGCDEPATHCDVDHTIPYPYGPTQASNLKCLCRRHHLLKTFWNGPGGWKDRQLPDGTVIWTDPDGHTTTTQPGSRLLFPSLCAPTAPVALTGDPPATINPELRMPMRTTTRAQARRRRIEAERRANDAAVAQEIRDAIPPC